MPIIQQGSTSQLPQWNGDAVAAAMVWLQRHEAAALIRVTLLHLAVSANKLGVIGFVPDRVLSEATGLSREVTRSSRVWLIRRGALIEEVRPGMPSMLRLSPALLGCLTSGSAEDPAQHADQRTDQAESNDQTTRKDK